MSRAASSATTASMSSMVAVRRCRRASTGSHGGRPGAPSPTELSVGQDGGMTEQPPMPHEHDDSDNQRVVVVGPNGMAVEMAPGNDEVDDERSVTDLVDQPAKVMRIGSMIKQLLEEVRGSSLDEASRARLKEIHQRSIKELEPGPAPELVGGLERSSLP